MCDIRPPVVDGRNIFAKRPSDGDVSYSVDALPDGLCQELVQACQSWGMFHLKNTGLHKDLVERAWNVTREFFDLPKEVKETCRRRQDNPCGWADNELTKQKRDLKEVYDWTFVPRPDLPDTDALNKTIDGCNLWPLSSNENSCVEQGTRMKAILLEYFDELARCSFILLRALCKGLGLDYDVMRTLFEGGVGFARLNFYERVVISGKDGMSNACTDHVRDQGSMMGDKMCSSETEHLGIQPHTDAGFLTILLQDNVQGLQCFHDGRWVDVAPLEQDSSSVHVTINVGDMFQVMTNDTIKAPLHRVQAPKNNRRYSMVFFFNVRLLIHVLTFLGTLC